MSSDRPAIEIGIFGMNTKPCAADCEPGGREEETVADLALVLARRFGDRVQVHYYSLLDPFVASRHDTLLTAAKRMGVPFPLVAVDNAVVQGGGIDYRTIFNAIEVKLESVE